MSELAPFNSYFAWGATKFGCERTACLNLVITRRERQLVVTACIGECVSCVAAVIS